MNLRPQFKNKIKRIVIKLGSLCVTSQTGRVRYSKMREIAQDIAQLRSSGIDVILVSSGAINAGRPHLEHPTLAPTQVSWLQACAAVGQPRLMKAYQKIFTQLNIATAQVLLTHDDVKNNRRYLNLRNTFETLLANKSIPIVNENDSVSFEEITLGDNDQLAAMVCEITQADALLLLSESDGLYPSDPRSNALIKPMEYVKYKDDLSSVEIFKKTSVGKGGMRTKLEAVKKLTPLGTAVILASFKEPHPVQRALFQSSSGSFFEPAPVKLASRKKARILARFRNHAVINIDDGAHAALVKNASLLPVGVVDVRGLFHRGDVVAIQHKKNTVAYGITEYDSKEIFKIRGLKSEDVKKRLGDDASKVVVHKNNLVLKD